LEVQDGEPYGKGGIMGTDLQKLPGLQAGRAIAALTVAYFHSYIALRAFPESAQIPIGPLKDHGYLGVNFFFAISGYVICLIASKPTFSAVPFAINRAFRLFPMYWVSNGSGRIFDRNREISPRTSWAFSVLDDATAAEQRVCL
jgi:hypothetical protein